MNPLKVLILQESLTKNVLHRVESLMGSYLFILRTPSDAVVEEIRREKIQLILIEWTGSSPEMREFVRELERVKSFVPRIALLSSSANSTALDPTLLRMDGVLKSPFQENVLHFMIEQLSKPTHDRWTRKAPRVEMDMPVEIYNATKTIQITARMKNLSTGGMFLELPEKAPVLERDEEIFFIGKASDDQMIRGTGLVRWIQNESACGLGIQFMNIDHPNQLKIQRLLPNEL